MKKLLLILLALSLVFVSCKEDEKNENGVGPKYEELTESPDVFEQNKLLGRGMNMGNMLEAPSEGEWGVTLDENKYFPLIKEAGFTSVRIPIRWSAHSGQISPYTINQNFMNRVKNAVDAALANELAVIINIHHFEEMFEDPAANRPKYLVLWEQISTVFREYPKELFFEVFNEPHDKFTPELWNEYLIEGISVIRKENPYRTIIAGTAEWGGIAGLSKLVLPADDRNIIATIHYYNPFEFTHQDADWVDGADQWSGTTWGIPADYQALSADFEIAKQWATDNNRPIHVGEFGAFSRADIDSREKWTRAVTEAALSRNMSFAYWEFCSGFGAWDKNDEVWNPQLLNALLSGTMF